MPSTGKGIQSILSATTGSGHWEILSFSPLPSQVLSEPHLMVSPPPVSPFLDALHITSKSSEQLCDALTWSNMALKTGQPHTFDKICLPSGYFQGFLTNFIKLADVNRAWWHVPVAPELGSRGQRTRNARSSRFHSNLEATCGPVSKGRKQLKTKIPHLGDG